MTTDGKPDRTFDQQARVEQLFEPPDLFEPGSGYTLASIFIPFMHWPFERKPPQHPRLR